MSNPAAWVRWLNGVRTGAATESEPFSAELPDRALANKEIEVCGLGRVSMNNDFDLPITVKAAAERQWQRWIKRQSRSPVDRDRALALVFQARRAGSAELRAALDRAAREPAARSSDTCDVGSSCWNAAMEAAERAAARFDEGLVRLATSTKDAAAYALAVAHCRGVARGDAKGPCALLSVERWAQLDPDNGAPWLFILDAALARKDSAARDEALHRVAQSRRIAYASDDLFRGVHDLIAGLSTPQEWLAVSVDAMGIWAALPFPGYLSLMQACSPKETTDMNRRVVCAQVAQVLLANERNLLGHSIAVRIAENAGLSVDRVRALKDETDALRAITADVSGGASMFSCDWVDGMKNWTMRVAAEGEVAAGRALIAASGRSTTDIAEDGRRRMRAAAAAGKATPVGP